MQLTLPQLIDEDNIRNPLKWWPSMASNAWKFTLYALKIVLCSLQIVTLMKVHKIPFIGFRMDQNTSEKPNKVTITHVMTFIVHDVTLVSLSRAWCWAIMHVIISEVASFFTQFSLSLQSSHLAIFSHSLVILLYFRSSFTCFTPILRQNLCNDGLSLICQVYLI